MPEDATHQDDSVNGDTDNLSAAFEAAAAGRSDVRYVLALYVTGMRPRSQRAIENIRRLCDTHLAGRYELHIIDIYQQPALAQDAQVIASPTLVKKLPLPLRRIVGDMSDDGRVLVAMGIKVPKNPEPPTGPMPSNSP